MPNNYNDTTLLILSYQPNDTLIRISKEFKEASFDVLIVNDGSDESFNPIFDECKKYATVLSYKKNHGKGYAIRYGVNYLNTSRKEQKFFITVDGDGQHLLKDVIKVADKLYETNEIVLAIRQFKEDVPFRSKFGNMWSRFTQTLTTDKYIRDNQCGLRGFPLEGSEFLLAIPGNRYEYEMNVISTIFMRDLKYSEVDIEAVYEKGNPTSHFKPFLDTCRIQGMLLVYGFTIFLTILIQMIGTGVVLYAFSQLFPNFNQIGALAIGLGASTEVAYIFSAGLNTLIYRPRRWYYHILRILYLHVVEMGLLFGSTLFFTFVLGWHYIWSYLIALVIIIFPLFFILKAINLSLKKKNKM